MELSSEQLANAISTIESRFLPYQRRFIYDTTRFLADSKAVRTGITYSQSYKSSKKRTFRHPDLPKTNELFASKNRMVASEYIRYHRDWAEAWNALMPGLIDLSSWTTEACRYPGGDVYILSSDPNAFRGMEGDVTLDEFAFHDQQDALFAAAQSRIQWLKDGQVSLVSSHSHPETTFNRLVQDWRKKKDGLHSVHEVTIHDAVREGLAEKVWAHRLTEFPDRDTLRKAFVKSIRDTCLSPEDFAREFECRPAALSELIWPSTYDAVAVEPVPDFLDPHKSFEYGGGRSCELFFGIDCGRAKDATVVWVIARYPDPKIGYWIYRTVCVKVIDRDTCGGTMPHFGEQHKMVEGILSHPQIAFGYIDQGAQGRALADSLHEQFGYVVQPLGMGAKNKGEMLELLRAFAQTERITFPSDNEKTKQSVCCIRRVATPSGGLKYEGSTSFDHGDRGIAAALAIYAAEGERKSPLMLPTPTTTAA
jgi:phage FluMu gp28-like protein